MKVVQQWRCDVCKDEYFDDYEEAKNHEILCRFHQQQEERFREETLRKISDETRQIDKQREDDLNQEEKRHDRNEATKVKPWTCEKCGKGFSRYVDAFIHERACLAIRVRTKTVPSEKSISFPVRDKGDADQGARRRKSKSPQRTRSETRHDFKVATISSIHVPRSERDEHTEFLTGREFILDPSGANKTRPTTRFNKPIDTSNSPPKRRQDPESRDDVDDSDFSSIYIPRYRRTLYSKGQQSARGRHEERALQLDPNVASTTLKARTCTSSSPPKRRYHTEACHEVDESVLSSIYVPRHGKAQRNHGKLASSPGNEDRVLLPDPNTAKERSSAVMKARMYTSCSPPKRRHHPMLNGRGRPPLPPAAIEVDRKGKFTRSMEPAEVPVTILTKSRKQKSIRRVDCDSSTIKFLCKVCEDAYFDDMDSASAHEAVCSGYRGRKHIYLREP